MGLVRAKKDVYLNEHGYHAMGTEFEYVGPDNENLESVEAGPYASYGEGELREEIRKRGLTYVAVATHKDLEAVLAEDDTKKGAQKVEPKEPKPAKPAKQTPAEKQYEKFMQETSGGFHSTDDDWTTVGLDASGFPVPKGSPEDVSNSTNPPARKAGSPK